MNENGIPLKILVVEDDVNLGLLLVDFLESSGFEPALCRDGISGLKAFRQQKFDFCILDLMLPGLDGFSVAEKIKEADTTIPVIILSARSLKEDKIKGFRLGIDDYITKPFDEEELLYRIKAILNRVRKDSLAENPNTRPVGKFVFDQGNQLLIYGENNRRLTLKESMILGLLIRSKNNLVKREDLMTEVWGDSDYYTGRSLDVFVSKIRSYLKADPEISIVTIPTVGYILEIKEAVS
jgi:DNA-binding response OmpR family regulator